jgi:hypothetical protein
MLVIGLQSGAGDEPHGDEGGEYINHAGITRDHAWSRAITCNILSSGFLGRCCVELHRNAFFVLEGVCSPTGALSSAWNPSILSGLWCTLIATLPASLFVVFASFDQLSHVGLSVCLSVCLLFFTLELGGPGHRRHAAVLSTQQAAQSRVRLSHPAGTMQGLLMRARKQTGPTEQKRNRRVRDGNIFLQSSPTHPAPRGEHIPRAPQAKPASC